VTESKVFIAKSSCSFFDFFEPLIAYLNPENATKRTVILSRVLEETALFRELSVHSPNIL
jgi:hypothetical protein